MNKKAYWIIRLGLAFVFIWFGVDKLVNPINWFGYVPGWTADLLPFSLNTFILLNGITEIIIGGLLLIPKTVKITAIFIAIFLLGIILSLGFSEVTVRDVGLLAMALSLIVWRR